MSGFRLSEQPVDISPLRDALRNGGSGGFCSFEGWVRDSNEGRKVSGLEYEAYAELALVEGASILEEARARFDVLTAQCVHCTGDLKVGDLAVWIGVSAAHRDQAFRGCRYIIDEIKRRLPIWKKEHYLDGDTAWVACSHTEREHESQPIKAHARHHHRPGRLGAQHFSGQASRETPTVTPDYSRQIRLREVGEVGQAKLGAARVLVIGAGGLGCPVLSYLAGAGVGTLGIIDPDRLDASNLHRQTMFDAADVGERKVDLAARRIAALNPSVDVHTRDRPLRADDAAQVFADYDLVVECSDDMASRYLCNDAAVLTGTPLILASVYQYEGQLQVVSAQPGDPCLRCLWPEQPAPGVAGSCADSGVLGPVPGVLGAMQAAEALKRLLNIGHHDHGLLLVNLLDGTSQRLPIEPSRGCEQHGGCVGVARRAMSRALDEIGVGLVFDSLNDALAAGYVLIDLRGPHEIALQPIGARSRHIPSSQIIEQSAELGGGLVLLICSGGRRSGAAARVLREQGKHNVYSLAGGLASLRLGRDHVCR
jgi:molybdopterin/thiamine biosynthesis adenylyltransferase/molybdopterin synthase catalytic subunit/rhodanese-related sulfurtransferase